MKYILVLFMLLVLDGPMASAASAAAKDSNNYFCGIAQYDYKTKYKLYEYDPIEILPKPSHEDLPGKAIAHFHGVVWYVNFYDQKISIEARNARNESISLASAPTGSSLSLQLPSVQQIIVCNKASSAKGLLPSTEVYGGVKSINLPKVEKQDPPRPNTET